MEDKKKKRKKSRGLSFLIWRQASARKCPLGLRSVVGLLQVCVLAETGRLEVLLQHVSVCRLYPLVVVLLRLNDLKAKLPVEVNCRLVADLDMPEHKERVRYQCVRQYISSALHLEQMEIRSYVDRDRNNGVSSGTEILVFPNPSCID